MIKRCNRCKELKELHEFNRLSTSDDGFEGRCRACNKELKHKFRKEVPHTKTLDEIDIDENRDLISDFLHALSDEIEADFDYTEKEISRNKTVVYYLRALAERVRIHGRTADKRSLRD